MYVVDLGEYKKSYQIDILVHELFVFDFALC